METEKDKDEILSKVSNNDMSKNNMKTNSNDNNPNNNLSNNVEYNKLQGFDVLEQLPKKQFTDTYNQEFYNTLDNLKFLSLSVPDEDKLFYHFEQNENTSVSATTGQIIKTFMELFMNKMTIRKTLRKCIRDLKQMKIEFDDIEPNITEEIRVEIMKIEKKLQNYLVSQKTETIRLIKEIAILQKEKEQIKDEIEASIERLNKLEKIIGTNKDNYTTIENVKLSKKNVENKNIEEGGSTRNKNDNAGVTVNTVSSPGDGLSEKFNINTIETNNFT